MQEPHRQCASILLTHKDKRILSYKQNDGLKFYCFPGGVVNLGETPPMAALREAFEEVSLDLCRCQSGVIANRLLVKVSKVSTE
jgi:8-oxo-dGTP pyrophosphatase MutT (NUDIX family)